MKKNYIIIVLVILFIRTLSGCTALVPDSMLNAIHQDIDKNHDGYVDYNEYLNSSSDEDFAEAAKEEGMSVEDYQKKEFNRADADRNGKVTAQELIDLFRK